MSMKNNGENVPIEILCERFRIPKSYVELLKEKRNIEELWKPQFEALQKGILSKMNFLMMSTPGSGKTLVAEFILLKSYLDTGSPGVYLVPFKALANQKRFDFDLVLGDPSIGLGVSLLTGDTGENEKGAMHSNIVVMTFEKFNYFVKNFSDWVSKIGCLVIDEINYIGDITRGPELEIIITYMKERYPNVKLVGLSAVIPNYEQISEWLGGGHYCNSEWRKNPLYEGIYDHYAGETLFYEDSNLVEKEELSEFDSDPLTNCVLNYLSKDKGNSSQFLIYVPMRTEADGIAEKLSQIIADRFPLGRLRLDPLGLNSLVRELEKYDESGSPTLKKLRKTLKSGIAFHRAGMTYKTRKAIESSFESGQIMGIVATSTLSMGINLPVRRIFISKPSYGGFYGKTMSVGEYKNLAGRAGRPSFSDEPGESVLICNTPAQAEMYKNLFVMNNLEDVKSQFGIAENFEGILLGLITDYPNFDDLMDFMRKTLYGLSFEVNIQELEEKVAESIKKLITWGFLVKNQHYLPTQLGSSVAKQMIRPFTAHYLLKVMNKLHLHEDNFVFRLLTAVFSTPEFQNGERFWSSESHLDTDQIKDFLEINHLSLREIDKCILSANIMGMWIEREKTKDIYEKSNIDLNYWGQGDLRERIAPTVCRVFRSLRNILKETDTNLFGQYGDTLEQLEFRVKYGIRQEDLPFVQKGLTFDRKIISNIREKGFHSPEDFLGDISEIAKKISRKRAIILKRRAVLNLLHGFDKEKELVLLEAYEQKLDMQIFVDLLETCEEKFHQAAKESMDFMEGILDWSPCDEPGNKNVPDIIASFKFDRESKIGIEFKSTRDLKKPVSRDTALDVLKKCPEGKYSYRIVIGTPDFTEETTKAAQEHNILLIPAVVFARLLLYVRKGKFTSSEIQEILQRTGKLSKDDLERF